jgi:hypothetical protein
MRIFTTRAFNRLGVASEFSNTDLIAAVAEMNDGLWDANLGGQVYKKRVALAGRGKSGGARTLVAFKSDDRAFFMYGFAKNQRSNIAAKEKQVLKRLAGELLRYSEKQLGQALGHRTLTEIKVQEDEDD